MIHLLILKLRVHYFNKIKNRGKKLSNNHVTSIRYSRLISRTILIKNKNKIFYRYWKIIILIKFEILVIRVR